MFGIILDGCCTTDLNETTLYMCIVFVTFIQTALDYITEQQCRNFRAFTYSVYTFIWKDSSQV